MTKAPTRAAMRRSRIKRWLKRALLAFAILVVAAIGFVAWVLLGSLPKTSGEIRVADSGLSAPVTIGRDSAGIVTITAQSDHDADFALGFTHAQERLFQMELMRRLGSGRLSELFGLATLRTDKLMRLLGLTQQASAQYDAASPELRASLDAYAAGVNAYMRWQHFPLPPEFVLLGLQPEPWKPTDSLLWGRIMAWQLSGNAGEEIQNERLRQSVGVDFLPYLLREEGRHASLMGFGPTRSASNNWVVAGAHSESGAPILANDPHLGFTAPGTWYMARIATPGEVRVGATVPGLPFLIIGSNGHVAWGFTTTHSDTQDLFEEHLSPEPQHYDTPGGPQPFDVRTEIIKVKGLDDVSFDVRSTRNGPLISDLDPERYLHRRFSLAWTGFLPDDRSPEAFLKMNHAKNAAEFKEALKDFNAPQQNVAFADTDGNIGFVAAGRVPVRRNIANQSLFPAPGWIDDYGWTGTLAFSELPQIDNPPEGRIVTANNDIRPARYDKFIGHSFDRPYRRDRILALLTETPKATLEDMERIQLDDFSGPTFGFVRAHLPDIKPSIPLDIAAAMSGWDGHMDPRRPEPLIATAWLYATARRVLGTQMGGEQFDEWWLWQVDVLNDVMADPHWCDDKETPIVENCRDAVRTAFGDALTALKGRYGMDWRTWTWGDAHEMKFRHPVLARLPYIGDSLIPQVEVPGDQYTVNRGGMAISDDGARFADIHGPGMRLAVDMSRPDQPVFNLAGGQSGHPFSRHYSDLLLDWAEGSYRTFQNPAQDVVILRSRQGVKSGETQP